MYFNTEIIFEYIFSNLSLLTAVLSFIIAFLGFLFSLWRWNTYISLKRTDRVNDLNEKIRTDSEIVEVHYMFEYSEDWYSSGFHGGGDLERKVDRTLTFYSYLCYLKEKKIISEKEFDTFFQYRITGTLRNLQVQKYLSFLHRYSKTLDVQSPFYYLCKYSKENGIFDPDSQ